MRIAQELARNRQAVFEVHILRIGVKQFFFQLVVLRKESQCLIEMTQGRVRVAKELARNRQMVFESLILRVGVKQFFCQLMELRKEEQCASRQGIGTKSPGCF